MKTLVLLSGGLDSSVCLAMAVSSNGSDNVIALNAHYGQKHSKETGCAKKIAEHYGVRYLEIDLSEVMKYSDCSLLAHSQQKVPEGEYADQEREEGKPVTTYVPFRNGVFVSVASAIALSVGAGEVVFGIHKDDIAGEAYPDCSYAFYLDMRKAVQEGSAHQLDIIAPFVNHNKEDIVAEGLRLGVPFELTWSCYNGGERPCGKCGTCIDRQKAFEANGVTDPLLKEE